MWYISFATTEYLIEIYSSNFGWFIYFFYEIAFMGLSIKERKKKNNYAVFELKTAKYVDVCIVRWI